MVVEHEVEQLLSSFADSPVSGYKSVHTILFPYTYLYFFFRPKFAVVVVKKRINTRLFSPDQRGQPSNPLPGTIVDCEVTKPEW